MTFIDDIILRAEQVIAAATPQLILCANLRISCEGWLKIELLRAFSVIERASLCPEESNVDIVVRRDGEAAFFELKTFPTNYGAGGKPITQFRQSVVDDLVKLRAKRGLHAGAFVVVAAYPIPSAKEDSWEDGMSKIRAEALKTFLAKKIQVADDEFAHIYFFQAK